MKPTGPSPRWEPGSFRDPHARVFLSAEGEVLRGLDARALAAFEAANATGFLTRAIADGRVVRTERVAGAELPPGAARFAAVLRHERVPVVSYPFEWSFGMLRDAALLQLSLLSEALAEGLVLKDATPYNVQFIGPRPVFVDVASVEPLPDGAPWVGYRQFCRLFLYPLLIHALRGVPFQPWLRGSLEGIDAAAASRILSGTARLRPSVLRHVYLQAQLEERGGSGAGVRQELEAAGFSRQLIQRNVASLAGTIAGLRPPAVASRWTAYERTCSYGEPDRAAKAAFVASVLKSRHRRCVWDLGANTGTFARAAAAHADHVLALEADAIVVDELHRSLRSDGPRNVLPLVFDLCDPSPGLGWRGRERPPLHERSTPDLVLCLALVHHLAIDRGVPLAEVVSWLRGLAAELVIELPHRDDPMVRELLGAKREVYPGYERAAFEALLDAAFVVERREELPSGARTLYHARARN